MSHWEGRLQATDGRFGVVVSRYNSSITEKLWQGALDTLRAHGVAASAIDTVWVPGAWEIPLAASVLAHRNGCVAVLCLGAVIRGETSHDQHINTQVSARLSELAVERQLPILFGVLTCNTMEQALHRAGGNVGNKGVECAEAALRMADLLQQLRTG